MNKISMESAKWHYKKIVAIHHFEYLTLAQKVIIFSHDLEHDILKTVTGKNDFFEQLNYLRDEQITVKHNIKTGNIRKHYISDLENLKNWRNEGTHENNMPEPKYKNHFHTMAQTIELFSDIPMPIEIINILNNQTSKNIIFEDKNIENYTSNLKTPFELIDNENEIINNILKFKYIIENERGSEIIARFSSFTYWYYFSNLDIFVPNKFLAYKNCAITPYENGCKMNGKVARDKLSKYFKIIKENEKNKILLDKFNRFSSALGQNVNVNVTFLEPMNEYIKIFNNL